MATVLRPELNGEPQAAWALIVFSTKAEIRSILRIALPASFTQLTLMLLWVVDTFMLFELSVEAQDSAALGRTWIAGVSLVGSGLLFGLDPIMSQAYGAGDKQRLSNALQQGLLLSLLLSIPVALLFLCTGSMLTRFGQNPELIEQAHLYAVVQIPALPFFYGFAVLRQFLSAQGKVIAPMIVGVCIHPLNALLNWALIFGKWGMPALGAQGAGIATASVQVLLFLFMAATVFFAGLHREVWTGWKRSAWSFKSLLPVLAIGIPISIHLAFELWGFQISTLWAGRMGEGKIELAAHSISLQLASLAFMLPLGIAIGATTRVGNLIGAGKPQQAQRSAHLALCLGAAIMGFTALTLILGRDVIPKWYTDDLEVCALAAAIFPIAAAFQVFDGVQVVGAGVLRGMGRTRPAAVFNFVAYYVLALPLGYWWGFRQGHGLQGIWWGLGVALAFVSAALLLYIVRRGPRTVEARVHG